MDMTETATKATKDTPKSDAPTTLGGPIPVTEMKVRKPREQKPVEMVFNSGDEVTIMRGTYRNQEGKVLTRDDVRKKYAVQFPNGDLEIINAVNVRIPGEATISATDLAAVLDATRDSWDDSLLTALDEKVPGITEHVTLVSVQA